MLPGRGAASSGSAAFSALATCAMRVTASSVLASGTKIATDDKEQQQYNNGIINPELMQLKHHPTSVQKDAILELVPYVTSIFCIY